MASKKRSSRRRMAGAPKFGKGNVFARTLKLTKGRGGAPCCNRKAALRAVKRGASPDSAVSQHCPAVCKVR